jgi:hypothetical protein
MFGRLCKLKSFFKCRKAVLAFWLLICLFSAMQFCLPAFAEPTEPGYEETTQAEAPAEEPEPDPQEPETEPSNEPEPEEPEPPQEETQAPADPAEEEQTEPEQTQPQQATGTDEPDNDDGTPLPDVDANVIVKSDAIGADAGNAQTNLVAGIISWLCVAIGLAVVIGVLLSGKRRDRTYSGGRSRYGSGNMVQRRSSGKKRLLPDDYYKRK